MKNWIDIVSLRCQIAQIYDGRHQYAKAIDLMEEAVKKSRELAEENPSRGMPFLAAMLHNLNLHYRNGHNYEKAAECGKESLQITRLLYEKYPQNYRDDLVSRMEQLATTLRYTKESDQAEELFGQAYQLIEQQYARDPVHTALRMNALAVNYANWLSRLKKYAEAESKARLAVETAKTAVQMSPGYYQKDLWVSLNCLGIILHNAGHHDEAESVHLEALETARRLASKDPEADLYRASYSSRSLALLYKDMNQPEKAAEMYRETIQAEEKLKETDAPEYIPKLARDYYNLGLILRKLKKNEEAGTSFRKSLEYFAEMEERNSRDEADMSEAYFWLAYSAELGGHNEEAETMYAEALNRILKKYDSHNMAFLKPYIGKCTLYRVFLDKQNKKEKAYQICREEVRASADLRKLNNGTIEKAELDAVYKCGLLANSLGYKEAADNYFREAVRLIEASDITGYEPNRAFAYHLLGYNLSAFKQISEAIASHQKALEIFLKLSETETKYLKQAESAAKELSGLYRRTGNQEEADRCQKEWESLHARNDEIKYPDFYRQLKEFKGCGWGPQREMFTMEKPALYPVLNSIKNNNKLGDERNFFRLAEADVHAKYRNLQKLEPGRIYELYAYFSNTATPGLKEKGTLHNVRLQIIGPAHIEDHKLIRFSAMLTADNSNPDTVWCDSYVWAEEPVDLIYVRDSARLHSVQTEGDGLPLPIDLFSKGGTPIGISAPDGELPCTGNDYSGHVIFRMKVVKKNSAAG